MDGFVFVCNNEEVILSQLWCDGNTDCLDGTEERNCTRGQHNVRVLRVYSTRIVVINCI